MPVVADRAEVLIAAIDEVLAQVAMAKRPREALEKARADVVSVRDQLVDLHENWVRLDVAAPRGLTPARKEWEALPAGRLSVKDSDARRLLETSPTLRAMHKGGVDFLDFHRYDDERLDLATMIGDSFDDWHFWWDRFKIGVSKGDPRVETRAAEFEEARRFFDAMVRASVIAPYETWMYSHGDKGWVGIKPDRVRHLRHGAQPVGIKFEVINGGLAAFVNGDWLTSYAYSIINDHLARNELDYEIYSQVRYEAPQDVLRVSGDFDVLARAGTKALLIECKSGRIRREGERDDYAQIAAKADGFKRVLQKTKAEVADIEFLLVYNPHLSNPKEVADGFAGTPVRPIRPDEIRGTIIEMFKDVSG